MSTNLQHLEILKALWEINKSIRLGNNDNEAFMGIAQKLTEINERIEEELKKNSAN